MIHAGLQTFRIDGFSWRQLEPTQGIFNFSLYDAVIPRFQALGLKVITGCDHTLPVELFLELFTIHTFNQESQNYTVH